MNIFHFAYNFIGAALYPIVLPPIWCHEKRNPGKKAVLAQRLGYYPPNRVTPDPGHPRIWIHAVSVGEVKAAGNIVHKLIASCPNVVIILTTTTMTGQKYARDLFDNAIVRYAPVDLLGPTHRFIAAMKPDLLACMETEIWPNWILKAHRSGIKTAFLNGRISSRSIRSYMKVKPLMKPILKKVDAFSMISDRDARRIISLGAPIQRVRVNGNVKMDSDASTLDESVIKDLKRLYQIDDTTPVFIAGSIRGAEADILLDAYIRMAARILGMVFIIAPRHVEKAPWIAELIQGKGIDWQYRTELDEGGAFRHAPVVILNTIGELRDVYSIASVVFCGGSLVPLGGQNVLEAAAWAKPVIYGPSMDDFEEAKALLESFGGGICVKDGRELVDRAIHLLLNPDVARYQGDAAREAVLANKGAADRHARVISDLLKIDRK